MSKNKSPKHDDPEQSARFVEAAQKAEVDEKPGAFEKVFKKIVPSKKTSRPRPSGKPRAS